MSEGTKTNRAATVRKRFLCGRSAQGQGCLAVALRPDRFLTGAARKSLATHLPRDSPRRQQTVAADLIPFAWAYDSARILVVAFGLPLDLDLAGPSGLCLGKHDGQDTVPKRRLDLARVHLDGKLHSAVERADASLVSMERGVFLGFDAALTRVEAD